MYKRFQSIILLAVLSFCLLGCNSNTSSSAKNTELPTTLESEGMPSGTDIIDNPELSSSETEVTLEETETSLGSEDNSSHQDPEYTFSELNEVKYAKQTVNVRDIPCSDGNKLGSLSQNDEVQITGKCNETGWYRFIYMGSTAYVSDKYLSPNKIVNEPVSSASNDSADSPSDIQTPTDSVSVPSDNASVSSNDTSAGVTVPAPETGSNLVWVPTNGGKKYHKSSTCSNMLDPIQVTVETAEANGYSPCKRCY